MLWFDVLLFGVVSLIDELDGDDNDVDDEGVLLTFPLLLLLPLLEDGVFGPSWALVVASFWLACGVFGVVLVIPNTDLISRRLAEQFNSLQGVAVKSILRRLDPPNQPVVE